MISPEQELGQLATALRFEREEEEKRLEAVLLEQSIKVRKEEGLCRHPLQVSRISFGFGGAPEINFEQQNAVNRSDHFHAGSPVYVYRVNEPDKRYKAILVYLRKGEFKVQLADRDFPDDVRSGIWAADLRYDDKTFFEMELALNRLINVEDRRLKELRDVLLGFRLPSQAEEPDPISVDQNLNPSQQFAVNSILIAPELAIVHGPPGTGKTTTITEAIRILTQKGEKVLVCAPTNAACDLLTLKLASTGVDVLRMGHSTRLGEHLLLHSFDARLDAMPEMKLVKDLRKRSEQLFHEASKFKRNFGKEERAERTQTKQEAKALQKEARDAEKYAVEKLVTGVQAVVCTLVVSSDSRLKACSFDTLVIDEAGQALEPASWIPIQKARRVILAGDPHQLPPTVKSEKAARMGLSVSLLEKCTERTNCAVLLNEQYRMNKRIMGFSNEWFYDNALKAHTSVESHALPDEEPVLEFIDTAGCGYSESHPTEGSKESLVNEEEADLLVKHLEKLLSHHGSAIQSVGVIAPYRAQVDLLQSLVPEDERIVCQTVDGFQGQERDVIYISLTRSNEEGRIGFLADYRRMNVAMTRARRKLVVIGDSATIGGDPFFKRFIQYCEREEAYRSAWELISID